MVVSAPVSHNASDNDMTSSPDAGSRGFVAVNHASSNESSVSSRLSSPQDPARRGDEHSSQVRGGMYPQPHGQENSGHKRKRTGSDDAVAYAEQRPYVYTPSRKPGPQHMANRALHVLGSGSHSSAAYYQNGVEHNGHTWHSEGPVQPHSSVNGVGLNTSEGQMIEVLHREASVPEAQSRPWDHQTTTNGQTNHDQYSQETTPGGTTAASKRKRNFSNRTKTGCLTCRTRKKKCDEAQPVCNNCVRGGFTCKGYSVSRRVIPTKPAPAKGPVPLQSKDGQGDVSESSTYPGPHMETPHPNRPPIHLEGGQARPITIDDSDGPNQPTYGSSPPRNEPQNRPPYAGQQQWPPQQSQGSYTSDHLPPLSDLNRAEPPSATRPLDMSRPPTQGTSYPPHPPPSHQGQPPAQMQYPPHHAAPQPAAPNVPPPPPPAPPPAPPSQQSTSWQQPHSQEDVEKSKMLRSVHYNHFDPTLVYERQRCERALERYNAACKLDSGLAEQEVRNLLLKVIDPSQDTTHKFPSQNHGKGHIGLGVKIEAPFTCTYGYNVRIQDDVYVGKGCTFDDAGIVEIGPRTIIAPGVTILTTDYSKDLVHRKGTKGYWIANDVVISSGVVIGAKAVIYPGVRIEEGATVEACAVVRESLRANQIHRASPAQIIDTVPR